MKKIFSICFVIFFCFTAAIQAQSIPLKTLVQISRAEDELRFDKALEDLMKSADAKVRARATLAAGRISKDTAVAPLTDLLDKDSSIDVRAAAAFALGEVESIKGADAILKVLQNKIADDEVRARSVEAAGKIAAANAKDEKSRQLGAAILDALQFEIARGAIKQNRSIVLLGITAILRAKPDGGDAVAARFLTNTDARVRADAANTLSRLRSKIANEILRAMLVSDSDAIARANAARALGAAEDKDSFDLLLGAALTDNDSRVRVSAIRSLGSLKDARAADKLSARAEKLFAVYKNRKLANPAEKNELLEIIAALGRILSNSNNKKLFNFLKDFRWEDNAASPETEIAFARIFPKYSSSAIVSNTYQLRFLLEPTKVFSWQAVASVAQGLGEIANVENDQKETFRKDAAHSLQFVLKGIESAEFEQLKKTATPIKFRKELALAARGIPDILRAYAAFKTEDLPQILREHLKHEDVIVRATAVEFLGELPPEKIQFGDFEDAFRVAVEDEKLNDALLATIEAVGKQKTERATDFLKDRLLFLAKMNPKYGLSKFLARRRIIALLKEKGAGDFSDKLGKPDSIFTPPDYVRAVSRKNARAILTTEKGTFTIKFFPSDAPLTVDNFIKLARSNYFNGLTIHRVVPNFVVQDGDPRGDGNGGPGWEIRDEINTKPFERGTVGMALSGKDTGGSQWFVCHSPQPHLDGGYTVFGRVGETGMKIVDNLARGDRILSVKIIEGK